MILHQNGYRKKWKQIYIFGRNGKNPSKNIPENPQYKEKQLHSKHRNTSQDRSEGQHQSQCHSEYRKIILGRRVAENKKMATFSTDNTKIVKAETYSTYAAYENT